MPAPDLYPTSETTALKLPATGTIADVAAACSNGVYNSEPTFLSGAAQQVNFTYQRLGGNILNIEVEASNVYNDYEAAVLEYSKIINQHQAKNVLLDFLGVTTGSFDHTGELVSGSGSSTGELLFPRFSFRYSKTIAKSLTDAAGFGGYRNHYSASITLENGVQVYDLQAAVSSAAADTSSLFYTEYQNSENKRIEIQRVYYRSANSFWRFYGYYGGLSVVGNLNTYGQYSDDSTFEIVPVWQNMLQAQMYETNLHTRASHYSYEIVNNKLKIYPPPPNYGEGFASREVIWFDFAFAQKSPMEESASGSSELAGVNNINTLPFANIPYDKINSMGKDWIRWYALALTKETLGNTRGKVQTLPFANEQVTLNYADLLGQAKEEKETLRKELIEYLDGVTYEKLMEASANVLDNSAKIQAYVPLKIYVG